MKCIKPKPRIVQYTSATQEDCTSPGGIEIDLRYISSRKVSLRLPSYIEPLIPSDLLCSMLSTARISVDINNESSRKCILLPILYEALMKTKNILHIIEEKNHEWHGSDMWYKGSLDYCLVNENNDSCLLVVEAKRHMTGLHQVLCQAGCLLRERLASGKVTPVFAVLTNGQIFRFLSIDTDGTAYSSGERVFDFYSEVDWKVNGTLIEILQWFVWIINAINVTTPRASNPHLNRSAIRKSLKEIRECLGVRR